MLSGATGSSWGNEGCVVSAELSALDESVVDVLSDVNDAPGAEPLCAPPELCTTPDRGSDGESEPDASVDDDPVSEPDESGDELDAESGDPADPDASAAASAGVVTTAVPMPSATASAPTRPMALAGLADSELSCTIRNLG